jgi:hypothetical protein
MGEQQSDGGRTGRRRVHPGDPAPAAGFEALLAASLRAGHLDDEAERRAVHAFRAARDAGAHRARTRRRDDWRPRGRRGAGRSLKTALSVLLAGFTLGGVAFAAIGGTDSSSRGAGDERRPAGSSAAAPGQEDTGSAASSSPSASASSDRPAAARDTEARCRAYQQVKERGKSLEATAWQRLVDVAGGEKKVDGYCARKLTEAEAGATSRGTSGGAGAPAAPEIPATPAAPDIPVDPTTNAPANPTGAAPTTPTAPDADGVTEDVGGAGDSRPDTAADPDAGKDSARN